MSAHTPSPWIVGLDYEDEGEREVTIGCTTPHGFLTVAVAIGGLAAQDANARLIAAAPDLLDSTNALLFVVRALEKELGIDPETTKFRFTANGQPVVNITLSAAYERAESAIAKATGGAS